MNRRYTLVLSLFVTIGFLSLAPPAVAQSTCSGGTFAGEECSTDRDCNECDSGIPGFPCSAFGPNCPGTGEGVCSVDNSTVCTTDVDCVFGPGGTCVGQTPGVCGSTGTCVTEPVLPVELVSQSAHSDGPDVVITWETATETNNSGFAIEHATADDLWLELAFVRGVGTTTDPQAYSYRADNLTVGNHRFRLKQIDFDGVFEYFDVMEAVVEVPGEYVLEPAYPNPFNPTTTVHFAVSVSQNVTLTLYDPSGRAVGELYRGSASADERIGVVVDASGLASGTYQVRLAGESFVATERITLVK